METVRTIKINITPDHLSSLGVDADKLYRLLDLIFGEPEAPDRAPKPESSCEACGGCDRGEPAEDNTQLACTRFAEIVHLLGRIPEDSGVTEEEFEVIEDIAECESFVANAVSKVVRWCAEHPTR